MIDRLLQKHLEPIARDYHYWHLWRALARCWAAMALVGIGLILLHRLTGWWAAWVFPLFIASTVLWAGWLRQHWRGSKPNYRAMARQIEEENPKLHSLLLTAVEQQPITATGGLNYLQQRVIHEALDHNHNRPWGTRIFERTFFAQCAHWLALVVFLGVLLGLRIATPAARTAFLFTRVGLAGCDMGACAMLPRVIGQGRAAELLFTGRAMTAEEGERWGFFNRIVPTDVLETEAIALAQSLAEGPTFAHMMTKTMLNQEWSMTLDQAIEAEAQAQAICMRTEDFKRAFDAFKIKGKPKFSGD